VKADAAKRLGRAATEERWARKRIGIQMSARRVYGPGDFGSSSSMV